MIWVILFALIAMIVYLFGASLKITFAIFLILCVIGIVAMMISENLEKENAHRSALRRMRSY